MPAWTGAGPAPVFTPPKPGQYGGSCMSCSAGAAKYCVRSGGVCTALGGTACPWGLYGTCSPSPLSYGVCNPGAIAITFPCNLSGC